MPRGTYRCLAAVKVGTTGGSAAHNAAQFAFGMGWTYGAVSLLSPTSPDTASFVEMPTQTIAADAQSNREILDLGTVTIPPIGTPDNMTDNTFTLSIFCAWDTSPSGVSYNALAASQIAFWFIDYILLMPIDGGSNYTSKTNNTDYILIDSMSATKALYLVNASDVVQSFPSGQLGRSPEVHPNGTRICFLGKGAATLTIGDTFTLRVTYRPRFLHVMGV